MLSILGITLHSFSSSSGLLELLEVSLYTSISASHATETCSLVEMQSNEVSQLLISVINENQEKSMS